MKKNHDLDKINKILNNEDEFEKYINTIENNELDVPSDLSFSIINYIKSNSKNSNEERRQKKKLNINDILKIAACTILSLVLWQGMNKIEFPTSNGYNQKNEFVGKFQIYSQKLNGFMLKTISIERGDN